MCDLQVSATFGGKEKKEKDEFQQTLNQTLIGHGNLEGTIKKNKKK